MSTLFISDLHLDASRPQITALFQNFLGGEARDADALYILGDLFESWIGDDDDAELATQVGGALRALSDAGVPVFFMHGNRDFLLGRGYADRAGIKLLSDPAVIDLYCEKTLLMHGDTLCTDDQAYLKFREQVRNPIWQRNFLAQPLAVRREFAARARAESQRHTANAKPDIMDVNATAVDAILREHGVHRLIHGHTHRPFVHVLKIADKAATRIVLGDWYEQGSVLRVDADGARLSALI
ncbi:UDP-2,3-diacylglucosamine diphosphatase [Pseudolysobacter antarcticus]|uniref:UDP-2,3-diacylglucosamine hydrolase n=1 Tax=Pseudolysobacter antarcticus TaxID=2511995 RepID=A0A411HK82_9GAMM|nr:UDP-2,3-diacylglucosamine diphosphatase [Pseudolysobacter antarcticus]QBB70932.1 UDP-2,3-diacylglucosamine diphosphatase [Pseudolysobacter antarcticus]